MAGEAPHRASGGARRPGKSEGYEMLIRSVGRAGAQLTEASHRHLLRSSWVLALSAAAAGFVITHGGSPTGPRSWEGCWPVVGWVLLLVALTGFVSSAGCLVYAFWPLPWTVPSERLFELLEWWEQEKDGRHDEDLAEKLAGVWFETYRDEKGTSFLNDLVRESSKRAKRFKLGAVGTVAAAAVLSVYGVVSWFQ